jgi:23S rRNA (adenine2030-N6)-methyltransferase
VLSYQHAYHAGSLADVHKHAALAVILSRLCEKPKPLSYMESHAGRALYDLAAAEALKTGEAARGILRLLADGRIPPEHPYRQAIELVRSQYGANFYPGSPLIARTLLRPADRVHLMELHPQEHAALRRAMHGRDVHIHRRDGYEGVLAIAPPTPRRGLVLIDPSFEIKTEYAQVADFVVALHRKWPQAVIMLWYPLLGAGLHEAMALNLGAAGLPDFLRREVRFDGVGERVGMFGSGLIMINTPYGVTPLIDADEALVY